MKITVLEGSPNRNGSSNLLAEAFLRGAKEAGHTAEVPDAAPADIHPFTPRGTPPPMRKRPRRQPT